MATPIVLVNQSTLVSNAQLEQWLPALQTQISRDFAPCWGTDARLALGEPMAGVWSVLLTDQADNPADLGYHIDDTGTPQAKVFAAPTLGCGSSVSTVLSHELLEMLADPLCNRLAADGRHIVEVCDPVEENYYLIDNVQVSNFVLPSYFGMTGGLRFDFNRQLDDSYPALLPGGYIMEWNGYQWVSHFGRLDNGGLPYMAIRSGRSHYRASKGAPPEPVTPRRSSPVVRLWQWLAGRW